ncbi:hypothetical protein ACJX0J_035777, partial [Zea mays]
MFGESGPRNCFSTDEPISVINLSHIINIALVFKNDIIHRTFPIIFKLQVSLVHVSDLFLYEDKDYMLCSVKYASQVYHFLCIAHRNQDTQRDEVPGHGWNMLMQILGTIPILPKEWIQMHVKYLYLMVMYRDLIRDL